MLNTVLHVNPRFHVELHFYEKKKPFLVRTFIVGSFPFSGKTLLLWKSPFREKNFSFSTVVLLVITIRRLYFSVKNSFGEQMSIKRLRQNERNPSIVLRKTHFHPELLTLKYRQW